MLRTLIIASLLAIATLASADCSTTTVITEHGRILICTSCCLGDSCAVTCSR
jgi:hypothetical protein